MLASFATVRSALQSSSVQKHPCAATGTGWQAGVTRVSHGDFEVELGCFAVARGCRALIRHGYLQTHYGAYAAKIRWYTIDTCYYITLHEGCSDCSGQREHRMRSSPQRCREVTRRCITVGTARGLVARGYPVLPHATPGTPPCRPCDTI